MKTVYIAHPLRGDIDNNLTRVNKICQQLLAAGEIVPLSPLHAFDFVDPRGPQELVLKYCLVLLARSDELHVYGDWRQSEGCQMEIQFARENNIPVRFMEVPE
ncbi:DUF4406 domain-containing protein [Sporomusa sphaeroides]|uniref:DUF7768 domain-containing protein n=1 Tax=Sporomusa sphaeroides DSM 2875 TaxID=1337886 RepID=A0ABM9W0Q9_9FIRM|nr:DUF4406 domain-containing protein [Sporomusa sphaeroides]OLS56382.1 hypothetical protein SPSPH_27750 [Sporomusa sphaeroides DSM 2875]CVK18477.1 hypothetical protein SSPH_01115 [Sporomusa sphaeroides DSM 2875]